MFEYTVVQLFPFIYHFRDPQGTCFSVIQGEKLSLVIDTGYGVGNVRETVEKYIPSKKYMVINTHGHMDHTNGNYQFDEVYLDKRDYKLIQAHNTKEHRENSLNQSYKLNLVPEGFDKEKYINEGCGNIKFINVGDEIDLGNHLVRIIDLAGHTKGSIGIYLVNEKILFTGDSAIDNVWMFLKESTTIDKYLETLRNVLKLDIDYFITGHLMKAFPKARLKAYYDVCSNIEYDQAIKTDFPGYGVENTYRYSKKYEDSEIGICFQNPKEEFDI